MAALNVKPYVKPYDFHHLEHVKEQSASKKTLWITLFLTLIFAVVEVIGGIVSRSLALLSDSVHMFSDVAALGLSMTAIYLASRKPNRKYTFGFLRFEVVASLLNGAALAIIAIGIFIEGIKRIVNPQEIGLGFMLTIAVIGFVVNLILTIVLSRSMKREDNLNVRSALWHFLGDLLSSVGVIMSAVVIYFTGFLMFDAIAGLVIGCIIFAGGAKIVRASYLIIMESVPEQFHLDEVRADIAAVEGVEDVHEMHMWTIATNHYSLTAHVFVREGIQPYCVVLAINEMLKSKYGIAHSTIQTENMFIHPHGEYGYRLRNQLEGDRPEPKV